MSVTGVGRDDCSVPIMHLPILFYSLCDSIPTTTFLKGIKYQTEWIGGAFLRKMIEHKLKGHPFLSKVVYDFKLEGALLLVQDKLSSAYVYLQ